MAASRHSAAERFGVHDRMDETGIQYLARVDFFFRQPVKRAGRTF
jgi:hypothetical protein